MSTESQLAVLDYQLFLLDQQLRMGFSSVDTLKEAIPNDFGGRVRINDDQTAFWYSFHAAHTPSFIAMDMAGGCRILPRKSI